MPVILPDRVPWFVVGPLLGVLVVLVYALANRRLGVTGSYANIFGLLRRDPSIERWQAWFFGGLIVGGLLAAALGGGPVVSLGYGALGLVVPLAILVPLLFGAGILIGFGARWAGGCTSGHGIAGVPALSPASVVSTVTFMATAVVLTLAVHFLTGGAL